MSNGANVDGTAVRELLDRLERARGGERGAADVAALAAMFEALQAQNAGLCRALSEARHAHEQTEVFLASVCHELRGPLAALRMWLETLRLAASDPVMRERSLDAAEALLDAQDRLVEDLLDASLGALGRLAIERHEVNLAGVLRDAAQAARPYAAARGVALSAELDGDVGAVRGDAIRLRQVASNLLTNAIKFTPQGGRVELRAARSGASVEFSVRDTGRGIPADLLPRLFTPFARQDGSAASLDAGLGLGLTVVRQLVELHDGSVRAASEGPGHGALFTVSLPALEAR